MKIVLQKFLRDALGVSRRKAEELIISGEIALNGNIAKPGDVVTSVDDVVEHNGKVLNVNKQLTYILLNKPKGYLTTRFDPQKRRTVYDLLPISFRSLVPVGRLDLNSEGFLILTNDGDLVYKLTHPKFEIEKEYEVVIDGYLKPSEKQQIESGIETKEISTSKSKILINKQSGNKTDLNIIIHEGKKREIRRIFSVFGYEVIYLKRIRVGKLTLGNIKTGLWRELSPLEISLLTK